MKEYRCVLDIPESPLLLQMIQPKGSCFVIIIYPRAVLSPHAQLVPLFKFDHVFSYGCTQTICVTKCLHNIFFFIRCAPPQHHPVDQVGVTVGECDPGKNKVLSRLLNGQPAVVVVIDVWMAVSAVFDVPFEVARLWVGL